MMQPMMQSLPPMQPMQLDEIDAYGLKMKEPYYAFKGSPDEALTIYAQPEDDGSCSFYMQARIEDAGKPARHEWVRAYRSKSAGCAIRTLNWLIGWMS